MTSEKKRYLFPAALILISLGLSLPAVLSGFIMDDLVFSSDHYRPDVPFGYYGYIREIKELDLLPWWASSNLKLDFFRPLASATLHLDYKVFGKTPLIAHIHSAAWFAILLLGAFRLIDKLVISKANSRWAMGIFAFSICHTWTLGFVAVRHALMAGAFSMWSVYFYLQWRDKNRKSFLIAATALFLAGLLSSEAALGAIAFPLILELSRTQERWRPKLLSLAPMIGIAIIYVILYKTTGHGTSGSAAYLDPFFEPGAYLAKAVPKLVSALGAFTLAVPAQLSQAQGLEKVPLTAGVVSLFILVLSVLASWRRLERTQRRLVKWLGPAALLSMLPGLAGYAEGRTFMLFGVAFSVFVGLAIRAMFAAKTRWFAKVPITALALILCLGLLVMSPLARLGQSYLMLYKGSQMMSSIGEGERLCAPNDRVYLLNGELMMSYYAPFVVANNWGALPRNWRQLAETATDLEVERTGPDTFTIAAKSHGLINPMVLTLFREADDDLPVGKVIEDEVLRVEVMEGSTEGPVKVSFTIPGLSEPGGVCLLAQESYRLKKFTLPQMGQTALVPYVPPKI